MRSTLVALTIITLKNPSISPPPRAEASFPPQWVKNSTVEISKSSVSSGMALNHLRGLSGTKKTTLRSRFTLSPPQSMRRPWKSPSSRSSTALRKVADFQCHDDFWEETRAGSHLCLVLDPMSTTGQALMHEADHERPPVHAVQHIILTVAGALSSLHNVGIMHGGTKFFSSTMIVRVLTAIISSC